MRGCITRMWTYWFVELTRMLKEIGVNPSFPNISISKPRINTLFISETVRKPKKKKVTHRQLRPNTQDIQTRPNINDNPRIVCNEMLSAKEFKKQLDQVMSCMNYIYDIYSL